MSRAVGRFSRFLLFSCPLLSPSPLVCLSACLPACLSVCLPACLPVCLSICLQTLCFGSFLFVMTDEKCAARYARKRCDRVESGQASCEARMILCNGLPRAGLFALTFVSPNEEIVFTLRANANSSSSCRPPSTATAADERRVPPPHAHPPHREREREGGGGGGG